CPKPSLPPFCRQVRGPIPPEAVLDLAVKSVVASLRAGGARNVFKVAVEFVVLLAVRYERAALLAQRQQPSGERGLERRAVAGLVVQNGRARQRVRDLFVVQVDVPTRRHRRRRWVERNIDLISSHEVLSPRGKLWCQATDRRRAWRSFA